MGGTFATRLSRKLTFHIMPLCEGANDLPQVGLTDSARSLSRRMPSRLALALFGPYPQLTSDAQRKHTDLTPHGFARFEYLVIAVGAYGPLANLSNNTCFFKRLTSSRAMRPYSGLRPTFWDYPAPRTARRYQQHLNSGFDFAIGKGAILN